MWWKGDFNLVVEWSGNESKIVEFVVWRKNNKVREGVIRFLSREGIEWKVSRGYEEVIGRDIIKVKIVSWVFFNLFK